MAVIGQPETVNLSTNFNSAVAKLRNVAACHHPEHIETAQEVAYRLSISILLKKCLADQPFRYQFRYWKLLG